MVSPSSNVPARGHSDLSTNHGGTSLPAVPREQLTPITIDCPMTAMESVASDVDAGRSAMTVVVDYRPGSDAIRSTFMTNWTWCSKQLICTRYR